MKDDLVSVTLDPEDLRVSEERRETLGREAAEETADRKATQESKEPPGSRVSPDPRENLAIEDREERGDLMVIQALRETPVSQSVMS